MSLGWQPCSPPRTWPEKSDATAASASASELAVQSMGHGHLAESVQRSMAHTQGIQMVLVHVNELLEEKIQSAPTWPEVKVLCPPHPSARRWSATANGFDYPVHHCPSLLVKEPLLPAGLPMGRGWSWQ